VWQGLNHLQYFAENNLKKHNVVSTNITPENAATPLQTPSKPTLVRATAVAASIFVAATKRYKFIYSGFRGHT